MLADSAIAKLKAMAEAEFPQLTNAEVALLLAAPAGQWAYYDADRHEWRRTDLDLPTTEVPTNLPEFSETGDKECKLKPWGPERNVRAGLIRWLCVSRPARSLVDPLGLRLRAARIIGPLNLEGVGLPFQLDLQFCTLTKPANFSRCTIPNLSMTGSWTKDIKAEGLVVNGSVNMNLGFYAKGEIDLVGAKIDGNLDFRDATIKNQESFAIVADNVKATNVLLRADWVECAKGFRAEGTVWFEGATISGNFECTGAEFIANKSKKEEALGLERATVAGALVLGNNDDNLTDAERRAKNFTAPRFRVDGVVDLRAARCYRFEDSNWTAPILLDGFTYEIADSKWNACARLNWLKNDKTDPPPTQPYQQLAKYFDGVGKTADAKKVRIELEKKLYPNDDNPLKFLKMLIGYGYKPERAVIGVAAVCLAGWLVYWRSYRMRIMVPSDKDAAEALRTTGKSPTYYPRFNSLIASLEYTFPLVKLGQADKWQPDPTPAPPFTGNVVQRLRQLVTLRRSLRWVIWAQILLGWLLATLFVAAVTGLVQHGN